MRINDPPTFLFTNYVFCCRIFFIAAYFVLTPEVLTAQAKFLPADGKEVIFNHLFAPQEGLVSRYEKPEREEICLNGLWQFQSTGNLKVPGDTIPDIGSWEQIQIKIPSPWNVNGFFEGEHGGDFRAYPSYPKAWDSVRAAWMGKKVNVPKNWNGKRIILYFSAVAGELTVFVNGKRAGGGFKIFLPQTFDVTNLIRTGAPNQILVKVIASNVFDKPGLYGHREYLSGSFWGTFIAGIWQDVFLIAESPIAVSDVFVQPLVNRDELDVEVTITNQSLTTATIQLSGTVYQWINQADTSILDFPEVKWRLSSAPNLKLSVQSLTLTSGGSETVTLKAAVKGHLKLWSPDSPNLYGLILKVSDGGKTIDTKYQRFGWRQCTLKGKNFLLNGRPTVLRGDSWHFLGVPQMTRRYAYAWYRLVKDAGANTVRLHASVYPSFYLDMADEMGILIIDESAIWASDGGLKVNSDVFWHNCRKHIAGLVRRDRNHPSVFGWSVCNEILPVMRGVQHTPDSLINHCLNEISVWENICRSNDPTRTWISGDGEWDAEGRLPIINIHYGREIGMQRAAESGKPWGVGEKSMAYYGTPRQVSQFNGNEAYESDLGRMKGLAYECYSLLSDQQKYGAIYQSVFNIVWYGLQPLPLGKHDITKQINLGDGIFFRKFKEGIPGMQPERLGPYVSTLNPGYDPTLPLYRPWPMFDAIRDANLKNTHSPWSIRPDLDVSKQIVPSVNHSSATAMYLPENGDHLAKELRKAGVEISAYTNSVKSDMLLVDGSIEETSVEIFDLKKAVDRILADSGTVWIWNVTPNGAAPMSKILGAKISVTPRTASSFVVRQKDSLIVGLNNAALYFSENDNWLQMSFSLSGSFVEKAKTILIACPADWRQWNYKPEPVKTAALFRSEVERAAPLTAIATRRVGSGLVILCNLSPDIRSAKKKNVIVKLFKNEGVSINTLNVQREYIDINGQLIRALVCGSFGVTDVHDAYTGKLPAGEIKEDRVLKNRQWRAVDANEDSVFDFRHGLIQGSKEHAYAYMAVWIKSSKPLNDLLSEPDLPTLSFTFSSDDGCEVWLNGTLLVSKERIGSLRSEESSITPVLLRLGWNQLVIKSVQDTGDWKFTGRFGCSDPGFLSELQFTTEKPVSE